MNAVLKKLSLKDQNPILILNAPDEYNVVINDIQSEIHTSPKQKYSFAQLFVKNLDELRKMAKTIVEAVDGDALLWVCYPKGTSKKYKSDCKRDTLVNVMRTYNFEGVSLIAIDDDWSAMRVRHVSYIKSMKKS